MSKSPGLLTDYICNTIIAKNNNKYLIIYFLYG